MSFHGDKLLYSSINLVRRQRTQRTWQLSDLQAGCPASSVVSVLTEASTRHRPLVVAETTDCPEKTDQWLGASRLDRVWLGRERQRKRLRRRPGSAGRTAADRGRSMEWSRTPRRTAAYASDWRARCTCGTDRTRAETVPWWTCGRCQEAAEERQTRTRLRRHAPWPEQASRESAPW